MVHKETHFMILPHLLLQISPLAVAFFVEQSFYGISDDVFDGCYSYNPSNHAVTLTGYGNGYWEIRNRSVARETEVLF